MTLWNLESHSLRRIIYIYGLLMLGLKNTLTEMTSAVCAVCVAWRCEVRAMVENKAGKAARVNTGSLPNDLEGQICLVSFSIWSHVKPSSVLICAVTLSASVSLCELTDMGQEGSVRDYRMGRNIWVGDGDTRWCVLSPCCCVNAIFCLALLGGRITCLARRETVYNSLPEVDWYKIH